MSEKRLGFTRVVRAICENRHDRLTMHGTFVCWYYTLCVCLASR